MLLSVSLFGGRTLHTLHGACTMYNADCRHWAAKVDKVHGEGGQHIAQCTDHIPLQRYSAHCESNQSKGVEYSAQCKERHSALQRCMNIVQCTLRKWLQCTLHRWTAQSAHCKGGAPSNESCMQRPLMIAILNPAGGEHATNTPVERITRAVKEKP